MKREPIDFTGEIIENWKCGEPFTKIYGKKSKKKVYPCTCIKCGNQREIPSSDLNCKRNLQCRVCNDVCHRYEDDNLTGTRQGSFTIGTAFRKSGKTYYHVTCDCAKKYDILRDNLIRKKYQHCKCRGSAVDTTRKYGYLKPLRRMENGEWECLCDCGNICYKTPSSLIREENSTRSCGCKKQANHIAIRSDNTSGIKGVFHDKSGKWIAYINKDGKRTYLGRYDTKDLAAEAREAAEKEMFQTIDTMET